MRRTNNKPESLKLLVCGLALGCVVVTLLASRSLFGTGAAVVHQIRQPRRGLQVAPDAADPTLRLFRPAFSVSETSQVRHLQHLIRMHESFLGATRTGTVNRAL